jgi:hypothetical protein
VTGPTFHALRPSPRLREMRAALALDSSPRAPLSDQPSSSSMPTALTISTESELDSSLAAASLSQAISSRPASAYYPDLGSPTSVVAAAAAVAAVAPAELRVLDFAKRSLRDALASMEAADSARGELAGALAESRHGTAHRTLGGSLCAALPLLCFAPCVSARARRFPKHWFE